MASTKQTVAHLTVRVAWALTFPLVWVGLFTKGWFDFAYTGNPDAETPAFRNDYTAKYGLFGVDFESPAGVVSHGYGGWALVNSAHPNAYMGIHGSRITAILSAVACIVTAMAYYRSNIARTEVSVFILGRCAWLAAIDLALNLATIGLWGIIANSPAFLTVCESHGCFAVPAENVATSTISYSWGLLFVRAVLQALLLSGVVYLTLSTRASLSFRTPKSGEDGSLEPSAPGLVASPGSKMAV